MRLKWWGLYHDKPKVGTFMLRIKLPGGHVSPAGLRAIGEISNDFGRGEGELSTRQNVQLHWLELGALPEVFDRLHAAGLTSAGGCGDAVRNITGCPVAGLGADELFDAQPVVDEAAAFFYGNPEYSNLPRKHKITIAACADRCNAPEINCIALVGAIHEGVEGFGVLVGGGLSSVPRIARDLGVFVPREETVEVLRALLDAWKEDLRYRVSRVKARMKFMVDDYGPDGIREEVERRLGRTLAAVRASASRRALGPRRRPSATAERTVLRRRARSPRARHRRPADRRRRPGRRPRRRRPRHAPAELRPHERSRRAGRRDRRAARRDRLPARRQPRARVVDRLHRRAALQLLGDRDQASARPARAASGEPLRRRPGRSAAPPGRLPARLRPALGRRSRLPGHDAARRGRQAPPGLRRLPARRARPACGDRPARCSGACRPRSSTRRWNASSAAGWPRRDGAEDFRAFCDRTSDDELGVLVGREPARAREKEAEAA